MNRVWALVAGLLLVFLSPGTAPAADAVRWQPTGMSPNWIRDARAVDVTFEVESSEATNDVPVSVALSPNPLNGRSEITAALNQRSTVSLIPVKTVELDAIAGLSTWRIRVPAAALRDLTTGIYVIQIAAQFPSNTVKSQFLLPVLKEPGAIENVPLSILWDLSAAPSTISNGKFLNSKLTDQFLIDSPLHTAVDALQGRAGITVLVDPATVVDAVRISNGGSYLDGLNFDSATQSAAANWFTKLQATLSANSFYYLPYANADLNGLWFKNQEALAAAAAQT
ncbi:MAG: hypothetical protein RL038_1306, partial [Actinomycetota bacterium]